MADVSTSVLQRELGERYRIERELGRGGMGVVYLAHDLKLDRPVALKVLPDEYSADAALRARFLLEIRTAASFSHPNIVPVHAVEERPRAVAYAMGYVEGESVAQRVARSGPLGVREIVRLLQDIGYALAYAHGRGVVHRDIKPENIMLERATGRALLMDFGISRVMDKRLSAGLTRVGEVVGTPEYMSPEQAAGDQVDGRSDIYSLGLVAWYAVTGRTAMAAETTQRILVKQLTEPVPPVETVRPELPSLLSAAIDTCIAKAPEDRFATAEALVEAVDNAQLSGPDIPLPVRIFTQELGTMSLIIVFIALLVWYTVRSLESRMAMLGSYLPVVILFSVGLTRVHQTLSDARRLAVAGFTRDEILKGMRDVVDEHESLRMALRGDPDTRQRRRRTLMIALLQLAAAAALIWFGFQRRVQIGPHQYTSPVGVVIMVVLAMFMIGTSMALIVRSPIRMPVGERAFRRIWLGPVGRLFLTLGARGVRRDPANAPAAMSKFVRTTPTSASGGRDVPTSMPRTSMPAAAATTDSRNGTEREAATVARLEQRIASLEQWRREEQRRS